MQQFTPNEGSSEENALIAEARNRLSANDYTDWVSTLTVEQQELILDWMKRLSLDKARALIKENPVQFAINVCKAILGHEDSGGDNIAAFIFEKVPQDDPVRRRFRYRADLMLRKLQNLVLLRPSTDGFVRATDFIEHSFRGDSPRYLSPQKLKDTGPRDLLDFVLEECEPDMGYAVMEFADLVYQGLPLYRHVDSATPRMLSMGDPDVVYLAQKSRYRDFSDYTDLPAWARGLFYSEKDLAALQTFFRGRYVGEDSERAIAALRSAYHAHLGLGEERATVQAATAQLSTSQMGPVSSSEHGESTPNWIVKAREFATDITLKNQVQGYQLTKKEIAFKVAERLKTEGFISVRKTPYSGESVLRDALLRWERPDI